ncbi:MAG: hypothetical protein U1F08_03090 [Steroidobacteraceae bacterium]
MKLLLAALPSILLSSYSSLVIRWRVALLAGTAAHGMAPAERAFTYLRDPFIVSAYSCALLSSVAWFFVAERHPVSIALPVYIGTLFCIVTVGSTMLLKESLPGTALLGIAMILVGVLVVSRTA